MVKEEKDRRTSPRVRASLQLHLIYNDLDELIEQYSHNISEGGIFVETEDPLPVGSKVQLKISLVHQEIMYIDAIGEVVHTAGRGVPGRACGMGIRFLEISPEGQQFIREFVVSNAKEKSLKEMDKAKPKPASKKAPKTKSQVKKAKSARKKG